MNQLGQAAKEYLQLRRQLGFKLRTYDWYLTQFVHFMKRQRATRITTKLAVRWATCLPQKTAAEQARRLSIVRGFAKYCSGLDPLTEIPPRGLLRGRAKRAQPYIYTDDEISRLLSAARRLPTTVPYSPGLRGATYETLIGLLVVTGMRISEALRLDRDDINWTEGLLTIRETKWCKSRLVPLHHTTMSALRGYTRRRDTVCRKPKTASFFVDERWQRLGYYGVRATFVRLSREIGLRGRHDSRGPRMHDFRHRRAVCALIEWYREDADVEQLLPILSTYLGHVKVSDTYWYLTAVPELLQLAMDRVEHRRSAR